MAIKVDFSEKENKKKGLTQKQKDFINKKCGRFITIDEEDNLYITIIRNTQDAIALFLIIAVLVLRAKNKSLKKKLGRVCER